MVVDYEPSEKSEHEEKEIIVEEEIAALEESPVEKQEIAVDAVDLKSEIQNFINEDDNRNDIPLDL